MVNGEELVPLLGISLTSPAVEILRKALDPTVEVAQDEDASFLSFREKGVEFLFSDEGLLEAIFFFAEGEEGARRFEGSLPEGLQFQMDRESVREKLALPQETGGGEIFLRQEITPWDRYEYQGWSLHILYSRLLDSIRRVTLSLRKA